MIHPGDPSPRSAFFKAFISILLILGLLAVPTIAAAASAAFVQGGAQKITSGTVNSLPFTSPNSAGNLIVVYAVWSNVGTVAITDTNGNTYQGAGAVTRWYNNTRSSQVFYAANVAAGANTVRATFGTAITSFGLLYIHEYSGIATTAPLDGTASAAGTSTAMNSGSATTTNADDLIVGAGASKNTVTKAGAGFTTRSTAFGNRTEDRSVTAVGPYNATGTQNGDGMGDAYGGLPDRWRARPPPHLPAGFTNDVLATGFDLPTAIKFLPDGRMLVVELQGKIWVLPPPYTQKDPNEFLDIHTNVGSAGVQQGIYDIVLDPAFGPDRQNHYYYIFYTLKTPNHDRLSRFTANSSLTGTVVNSEKVLYEDPQDANAEHHGGALAFGNDGKLYFTTGDHFVTNPAVSQDLTSPRGKIHRINPDGTIPTDNPTWGGATHLGSVWAKGLRNPFRAYYDAPTGRFFVGDVGGNVPSTSIEEIELGAAGANYGWPNSEGSCVSPCTSPLYSWPHSNRDSAVVAGFVYHGTQFPSAYEGSFFFADYAQNWIKRMTLDASGNLTGVYNFEPVDGSADGPYGDIVYLIEGPDEALYYVDLGYSDTTSTAGISKIRRIRYGGSNQPPVASATANPTSGGAPLAVDFSSAGSFDPEGQPLTYSWTFGDGTTPSSSANPSHPYQAGTYSARLSVFDGVNTTYSTPITITAGIKPTATILSPQDGTPTTNLFRAGDVISYSGDATDGQGAPLPASAFTWNIDFLHDGHVHPGTPVTGVKSGAFTIPTSGHDFQGNTRYRITLSVIDTLGLTDTRSVIIYPDKVNLSFDSVPSGRTLYLDGIPKTTPFVYDTLVGFNHTIEAPDQSSGTTTYTFASWSDGLARQHGIVVPSTAQSYTATFTVGAASNLLQNPGFESDLSGWTSGTIATSPVHSGSKALQILARSTVAVTSTQTVAIAAGTSYQASGWLGVSNNAGGAKIQVQWRDASGTLIRTDTVKTLSGTAGWTQGSTSVTAPAGATQARFVLRTEIEADGAGQAWFDDLLLSAGP